MWSEKNKKWLIREVQKEQETMWQVFMEIDAKQIHIDIYKTPSNIYEEDQS